MNVVSVPVPMIGRKSYVEDGTFDCDYGQNIYRVLDVGVRAYKCQLVPVCLSLTEAKLIE